MAWEPNDEPGRLGEVREGNEKSEGSIPWPSNNPPHSYGSEYGASLVGGDSEQQDARAAWDTRIQTGQRSVDYPRHHQPHRRVQYSNPPFASCPGAHNFPLRFPVRENKKTPNGYSAVLSCGLLFCRSVFILTGQPLLLPSFSPPPSGRSPSPANADSCRLFAYAWKLGLRQPAFAFAFLHSTRASSSCLPPPAAFLSAISPTPPRRFTWTNAHFTSTGLSIVARDFCLPLVAQTTLFLPTFPDSITTSWPQPLFRALLAQKYHFATDSFLPSSYSASLASTKDLGWHFAVRVGVCSFSPASCRQPDPP